MEILAPIIAIHTWRGHLKGRACFLFNDSFSAGNILVKGYSNGADGVTSLEEIKVRVFALEMVYIPEGPFEVTHAGFERLDNPNASYNIEAGEVVDLKFSDPEGNSDNYLRVDVDNNQVSRDTGKTYINYDVAFSGGKLEREQMNWLYNTADCSILISSNEGFGLMGAETLMCGVPLIVNVSGGMQDYCGFKKEDGSYLTVDDYTTEWGSNHDGRYKDHGEWVFPVWPTSRSLQGSPATPYISDDRPDWQDVAIQIKKAWSERGEKLQARGKAGHEYVMNPEFGFTASEMNRRFMHDMDQTWKNFKPRTRIMIDNATKWNNNPTKWNGLTMTKEI